MDGTDFLASYRAMQEAAEHCREGRGPALVHAHVIRPYSHSLSDDERLYKCSAEREAEAARDPVMRFPQVPDATKASSTGRCFSASRTRSTRRCTQATQQALRDEPPAPSTALCHLYSETCRPGIGAASPTQPEFHGAPMTMVDLINATLREEMRRNPDILVFGEDVADCSREQNLAEVKGKGGVFKVTAGLQSEFGAGRCFNTPLAEAAIVGRAIGMATRGLKPVAEIQFFDYIWPAMMQTPQRIGHSCAGARTAHSPARR